MKKKVINPEKIKFKYMTPRDFEISLDRLTRFKFTEKKYKRVYSDIITKHLISPILNKNDIDDLDNLLLKRIVEKIWNSSLEKNYNIKDCDSSLNNILLEEENAAFFLSDELVNLISEKIDYKSTLALISKNQQLPLNLKRLILINNYSDDVKTLRERYLLKFPVEKVVLCEGITEEILLPKFASVYGYDFNKYGVHLISAGGKNQVAKLYCELKDELKLPIFILLDADAKPTSETINPVLRDSDKLYLIKDGEFEDLFSLTLIKRTINNVFKNILKSGVSDFKGDMPMTKILSEFYRENQLGDYQKADFAKQIYQNINGINDLTDEIIEIIDNIKNI